VVLALVLIPEGPPETAEVLSEMAPLTATLWCLFTKYQWSFYSSKTVISGNIDEQSVFTKHRLLLNSKTSFRKPTFSKHWLHCIVDVWQTFTV